MTIYLKLSLNIIWTALARKDLQTQGQPFNEHTHRAKEQGQTLKDTRTLNKKIQDYF